MIAQKKAEIAAKLNAIKAGGASGPANPVAPTARPPPSGAGPSGASGPVAVNQTDLARRIAEAKERIQKQMNAVSMPTVPAPVNDSSKRGLAIETHPVLEMLAAKGEEGAKGAKAIVPKPVFATTKVGTVFRSA